MHYILIVLTLMHTALSLTGPLGTSWCYLDLCQFRSWPEHPSQIETLPSQILVHWVDVQTFPLLSLKRRQHSGALVSTVAAQLEGSGLETLGFGLVPHTALCPQSKEVHVKLIGHSFAHRCKCDCECFLVSICHPHICQPLFLDSHSPTWCVCKVIDLLSLRTSLI